MTCPAVCRAIRLRNTCDYLFTCWANVVKDSKQKKGAIPCVAEIARLRTNRRRPAKCQEFGNRNHSRCCLSVPSGTVTESAMWQPGYVGFLRVAAVILSGMLFIPAMALSQDTPSQRRLSILQGPQRLIDQIHLLLDLKRFAQGGLPSAEHFADSMNLNNEQRHRLTDFFNSFHSRQHGLQNPFISPRQPAQSETFSDRQRLKEEIRDPASEAFATETRPRTGRHESGFGDPPSHRSQQLTVRNDRSQSASVSATDSSFPESLAERGNRQEVRKGVFQDSGKQLRAEDFSRMQSRRGTEAHRPVGNPGGSPINNHGPSFDISQELSRRGLEQTLECLVRDVRQKVQQKTPAPTNNPPLIFDNSAWNQALAKVLDTVRDEVVDMVRDFRNDRTHRPSENRRQQNIRRYSKSKSREQSVVDRSHMEVSATGNSAPSTSSPIDVTSAMTRTAPDQTFSLISGYASQLIVLLSGLGIATLAFLFAARRKTLSQLEQRRRTLAAVKPELIRTEADIVRAFHWLTECRSPEAADWWNHLQAQESLLRHTPGCRQSLEKLGQLYEAARYQPGDGGLDDTQIREARTALAGCLS